MQLRYAAWDLTWRELNGIKASGISRGPPTPPFVTQVPLVSLPPSPRGWLHACMHAWIIKRNPKRDGTWGCKEPTTYTYMVPGPIIPSYLRHVRYVVEMDEGVGGRPDRDMRDTPARGGCTVPLPRKGVRTTMDGNSLSSLLWRNKERKKEIAIFNQ